MKASWMGVLVFLGPTLAAAAPAIESSRETGGAAGRVVDLQGRPVARARVWAADRAAKVEARSRTDNEGHFRLESINAERAVAIWAEAPEQGLAREHFEDVRIYAGRETDVGDLCLVPGARLSGRVVDAKGQPVAGARAIVKSWHFTLGHTITPNGPDWTVRGADDGQIRTPSLPVGKTDITITAPGKARLSLEKRIEPGQSAIDLGDIQLDDEQPITGTVVDQDGKPVRGATVVIDSDWDSRARTDHAGHFTVRGAPLKATWIRVEAPGYFDPTLRPVHELKGKRTDLRMPLQKAYTVQGRAIDADTGAPVDFQLVQLCTVTRDEEGHITLTG